MSAEIPTDLAKTVAILEIRLSTTREAQLWIGRFRDAINSPSYPAGYPADLPQRYNVGAQTQPNQVLKASLNLVRAKQTLPHTLSVVSQDTGRLEELVTTGQTLVDAARSNLFPESVADMANQALRTQAGLSPIEIRESKPSAEPAKVDKDQFARHQTLQAIAMFIENPDTDPKEIAAIYPMRRDEKPFTTPNVYRNFTFAVPRVHSRYLLNKASPDETTAIKQIVEFITKQDDQNGTEIPNKTDRQRIHDFLQLVYEKFFTKPKPQKPSLASDQSTESIDEDETAVVENPLGPLIIGEAEILAAAIHIKRNVLETAGFETISPALTTTLSEEADLTLSGLNPGEEELVRIRLTALAKVAAIVSEENPEHLAELPSDAVRELVKYVRRTASSEEKFELFRDIILTPGGIRINLDSGDLVVSINPDAPTQVGPHGTQAEAPKALQTELTILKGEGGETLIQTPDNRQPATKPPLAETIVSICTLVAELDLPTFGYGHLQTFFGINPKFVESVLLKSLLPRRTSNQFTQKETVLMCYIKSGREVNNRNQAKEILKAAGQQIAPDQFRNPS